MNVRARAYRAPNKSTGQINWFFHENRFRLSYLFVSLLEIVRKHTVELKGSTVISPALILSQCVHVQCSPITSARTESGSCTDLFLKERTAHWSQMHRKSEWADLTSLFLFATIYFLFAFIWFTRWRKSNGLKETMADDDVWMFAECAYPRAASRQRQIVRDICS